jgi:predicted transposase YbfD/YdcC
LGQLATEAHSNEITAIPLLLDMIDIKGDTVTIDAIGCQTEIAAKIRLKQADYVLCGQGKPAGITWGDKRILCVS